jgi:hypothetical protein
MAKVEAAIEEALFVKLALLLLSKRKYFPVLFPSGVVRECKIYKYVSKIGKAVNPQVLFLSSFLKQLSQELPQDL